MPIKASTQIAGQELGTVWRTLGVFREPFAWLVMALSTFVGTLVFVVLALFVQRLVPHLSWLHTGWLERFQWDEWVVGGLGYMLVVLAAWFTMPLIVTAVVGIFLEPLADRIERRCYPGLPVPRQVGMAEQIASSVRTLTRTVAWNLLFLPLYFIPLVNVVVYFLLNAFLLSREYFQVVAVRHMTLAEAKEVRRRHGASLMRGGLVLAALFVTPVLNIAAPLLATAWMVHRVWAGPRAPLRLALLPDGPRD